MSMLQQDHTYHMVITVSKGKLICNMFMTPCESLHVLMLFVVIALMYFALWL